VAGDDGLDEVSASATTKVVEVNGEEISQYVLDPRDLGIELAPGSSAARGPDGGTPAENALVTRAILHGEHAPADVPAGEALAVINAGAAIYAAGRADSIAQGVQDARAALHDGSAASALERYVQASHRHAPAEGSG